MFNLAIAREYFAYSRTKLVVAIVISIAVLSIRFLVDFNAENTTAAFWFYFLITGLPSAMLAAHFAVPFTHFASHHLWRINPRYRLQMLSTMVLVSLIFSFLFALSSTPHWSILGWIFIADFSVSLMLVQLYFSFHFIEKVTGVFIIFAITFGAKKGIDYRVISSIFLVFELLLVAKAYRESLSKGRKISFMMVEILDPQASSSAFSKSVYSNWFVKAFGSFVNWKNKDIGWALSLPFTRIGALPLFFFIIILLMSIKKETREVSEFLIIAYTLSISISIPMEASGLLRQLRPIFHLYPTKKFIIKSILRKIEKLALVQSLIFILINLLAAHWLDWNLNPIYLLIALTALYCFNWAVYPFLIGRNIKKVSFNGLVFMLGYGAMVWFVLFSLKHAPSIAEKIAVGGIFTTVFLLIRILSSRRIYSLSLEALTAGGCRDISR